MSRLPKNSLPLLLGLLGPALLATLAGSCGPGPTVVAPPADPPRLEGDLATHIRSFCGHCHVCPDPATFPRSAWKEQIEQMYRFFGLANLPLRPPPIDAVIGYYQERAPDSLPEASFPVATTSLRAIFERIPCPPSPERATPDRPGPHISHVQLLSLSDPRRLDLIACEMSTGAVLRLRSYVPEARWEVLGRVPHPAHAEVTDLDGDGIKDLLVASLGSYFPSDRKLGGVWWLRGKTDGTFVTTPILEHVGRVADVQAADFRSTGKLDLVVACFGWRQTGEVFLLENHSTPEKVHFVPRVLDPRHGAIHVPVIDLNGDGRPDFIALLAQEHETIVAFLNEGQGKFRQEVLFRADHPGYGSSGIQLVDLDGDGDRDILYTNGDVLDSPYLLKPYHGVQWLENPGKDRSPWIHHALTPLYGAHRAVAGDVDGDGDMDLVAVSFLPEGLFPQRKAKRLAAVVVLEQTAPGVFARHVLEEITCDHVACALGDIHGSGRLDLVVGTFSAPSVPYPATIWRNLGLAPGKDKPR